MKRLLIGLCAVTLLMTVGGPLTAQDEEQSAAEDFKSLIEQIYELRESDKLSKNEWSKVRTALNRLTRKLEDKSAEERAELYRSTGDYLIELLDSAAQAEEAVDENAEKDRRKEAERRIQQEAREMAKQAEQNVRELELQAKELELRARDMERAVRDRAAQGAALAQELAEAQRAAQIQEEDEDGDDDEEEGEHGLKFKFNVDGEDFDFDAENLSRSIEDLVGELQGMDEVGGRLEALMDLNSNKLEAWAEEHSHKWESWAEEFEKAAESFGREMEDWAENEMEPWAEEYSRKWEEWAEKLEEQGLDNDELAELIESNMEMIAELPVKDIYNRAMERLEESDLFSEEKMDELGEMVRESVEQALEAIEEDEDVAELLNLSGEKGQDVQRVLEKLLQETDRKKAQQMQAAELEALAAQRHAQALDQARAIQQQAALEAERAQEMALQQQDRMNAQAEAVAREAARLAELEQYLEVERQKRAEADRLLKEQQKLQMKNSEVEELRAQMEALRRQLEELQKQQDDDEDEDEEDDHSLVFARPVLV